jgi:Flp pilus assembly protein TadG
MISCARPRCRRRGAAVVEFAILIGPMLLLLAGTWEVGRFIEAQQILTNAAREGVRLAVTGQNTDSYGNPLQQGDVFAAASPAGSGNFNQVGSNYVQVPNGTGNYVLSVPDSVKAVVKNYITNAGLDTSTMLNNAVSVLNLTQGNSYWQAPTNTGQTGSSQNDHLRVSVTFPADKIRWVFLPGIINLGSSLTATVDWQSVEDIPITVPLVIGPN